MFTCYYVHYISEAGDFMKNSTDTNDASVVNEEVVKCVREQMPEDEVLYYLADLFKMLGDFTRVKILSTLFVREMCVCDIAELIEVSPSAVSHQLRLLKQGNFVKFRRVGKSIYYSIKDEHVKLIFDQGLEHVVE